MTETRTTKQIAANKLDLELFNMSAALERFAEDHKEPCVDDCSRRVFGMRGTLRKYMHRNDIKRTE